MTLHSDVARYIAMGLRPVPLYGVAMGWCMCGDRDCKERDHGKHTHERIEEKWKDGHRFAPRDFWEGNNVALAMGPWDGGDDWLVCLDVDGVLDLSRFMPRPPVTLSAKSPRGEHLIYRVPAYTPLGNWVDVFATKPGPSLDLRYARGRIVVAPSRNAFGAYEWTNFVTPVPLPEHVIDVILERRRARGLDVQHTWDRGRKRA
jgi:hypothetical protein